MGDTSQLGDSPGNLVEFPWGDLHFPYPALEYFEFWLSLEGLNFCEGQIRTGLCSQGKEAGSRAEGKGKRHSRQSGSCCSPVWQYAHPPSSAPASGQMRAASSSRRQHSMACEQLAPSPSPLSGASPGPHPWEQPNDHEHPHWSQGKAQSYPDPLDPKIGKVILEYS